MGDSNGERVRFQPKLILKLARFAGPIFLGISLHLGLKPNLTLIPNLTPNPCDVCMLFVMCALNVNDGRSGERGCCCFVAP